MNSYSGRIDTLEDVNSAIEAFKTMTKKELEVNFDRQVTYLSMYKGNKQLEDLCVVLLDSIADELYTRINNKLH